MSMIWKILKPLESYINQWPSAKRSTLHCTTNIVIFFKSSTDSVHVMKHLTSFLSGRCFDAVHWKCWMKFRTLQQVHKQPQNTDMVTCCHTEVHQLTSLSSVHLVKRTLARPKYSRIITGVRFPAGISRFLYSAASIPALRPTQPRI
jgi:hypothetical protein